MTAWPERSPIRYYEHALSSSLMIVLIGMLIGLWDLGALIPAFVYAIVPTLFVFFNIFATNMVLQYKKVGRWKDYLYGERVYIILSLSAKTVLCWLIFTGTLAPVQSKTPDQILAIDPSWSCPLFTAIARV